MPDTVDDPLAAHNAAAAWLARFDRAITAADTRALADLFVADSHWRDAVALTWSLQTTSGVGTLVPALAAAATRMQARGFAIDPDRTLPRVVTRVGRSTLEVIFRFETALGHCSGVLRLTDGKAWTLFTALEDLKGHEEHVGRRRPSGHAFARDFRAPNWLDQRNAARAFADRDPAVLVVGCGQAGLAVGARLAQLDVDTLIVDRLPRIGDNWRKRYHALTLHNQVQVNHLPYMPFPPSWPTYIPKDKLGNWFEAYVEAMDLNVWTGTELVNARYDERWTVELRRPDGSARVMHPRHLIMATGVSSAPNRPAIPTLADFAGTVLHSSEYEDGIAWQGKRALVIGTGTSGHDIAQDLHAAGAAVTMVQRNPTLVVSVEPSGQLAYALYDEGPPLDDCDLIAASMPFALMRETHIKLTAQSKEIDREILAGLTARGFKLDDGAYGAGWQFNYLTRGGGYYFNVGCSELIASGAIGLVQFEDIAKFERAGARIRDGRLLEADLIVLATGYKGQSHMLTRLFGAETTERIGAVWGFGEENELRNMYVRTPQPGLWFIAGGLAQCRIFSKYLAQQIKGCELGLIPKVRDR